MKARITKQILLLAAAAATSVMISSCGTFGTSKAETAEIEQIDIKRAENASPEEQLVAADKLRKNAEIYAEKEDMAASFEAASQAFKLYRKAAASGNVKAMIATGECYERGYGITADGIEAAQYYRKAADKGSAEGRNALAMLWCQMGQHLDDAAVMLDQAIAADPSNSIYKLNKGKVFLKAGKKAEAFKAFDEVLAASSDEKIRDEIFNIYYTTATSLASGFSGPEAIVYYDEAIELKPDNASLYMDKAVCQMNCGYAKEAMATLDQAENAKNADKSEIDWLRARSLQAQGAINDALAAIGKAIAEKPKTAEYLYTQGQLYVAQGELDKAMDSYIKALDYTDNKGNIYWELLNLCRASGKFDEAVKWGEKLAELKGDDESALRIERGRIYLELNMHEKALTDFEKASELSPGNTEVLMLAAYSAMQAKKYDIAISYCDKALAEKEEIPQITMLKIDILCEMKKYDDAIACIDAVLKKYPDAGDLRKRRSYIATQKGDYKTAAEDCEKVLNMYEKDPSVRLDLAEIKIMEGDALSALNHAVTVYKNAGRDQELKLIASYLEAVSLKILGRDPSEAEKRFNLLAKDNKAAWSTEFFEDWLKDAKLPPETLKYISDLTLKMKDLEEKD